MLLGYNTNGFAHHRLEDALVILGEQGYQSVAITVDYHALEPTDPNLGQQVERVHAILYRYGLRCVIETGARFLLDPWRKHQPTLLSDAEEDRQRRLDFLCRCVDFAEALNADAVSFWSGAFPKDEPQDPGWQRLVEGCRSLAEYARSRRVRLAFEPEPGMFIDTMARFADLHRRVDASNFGLTLDVGHVHCLSDGTVAEHVHHWRDCLWNIHLEDMVQGVHDHRMFGEGEMDFPPIFQALRDASYSGGLHVELSRHSHDAVRTAQRSLEFLRGQIQRG